MARLFGVDLVTAGAVATLRLVCPQRTHPVSTGITFAHPRSFRLLGSDIDSSSLAYIHVQNVGSETLPFESTVLCLEATTSGVTVKEDFWSVAPGTTPTGTTDCPSARNPIGGTGRTSEVTYNNHAPPEHA